VARVPIVRVGPVLISTLLSGLLDQEVLQLQEELMDSIEQSGARGVLLDISTVETVDTFLGRLLADIAAGARLMGAHTVVVGLQPAVAVTLVEMGLEFKAVHVALNAEKGWALLRRLLAP